MSPDEIKLIQQARDMQDLVASPGFKSLQQIMQNRINAETKSMIEPGMPEADGVKVILVGERQKGAIFGMLLAINTPSAIIEQSKQILDRESAREERKQSSQPATKDESNVRKAP